MRVADHDRGEKKTNFLTLTHSTQLEVSFNLYTDLFILLSGFVLFIMFSISKSLFIAMVELREGGRCRTGFCLAQLKSE